MPGKDLVPRPAAPLVAIRPPWQPDRDVDPRVPAWRWLLTRRHWTAPVALLPAVWLAGLIIHAEHWGVYFGMAALPTFIFTFLVACSGKKWNRRGEQVYAVASVLAFSLWLELAGVIPVADPWFAGTLAVLVLAWGILWWRHKRPRGHRRRQRLILRWDTWWQSLCYNWNLGGSKVTGVWQMDVTTKVRVQALAGRHSKQHFEQAMHLIETGTDTHPDQDALADVGMIRVEQVKGRPSQFDLYFKRRNPLAEAVPFDLSLAPRSVHDPLLFGMSETGEWVMKSAKANRFCNGVTQSGKSNDLLVAIAQLSGCPNDRQILIDLKGGRSARPLLEAGAVDCVVTDIDEARMLERMLVAENAARQKHWYTGDQHGHADEDTPALHLMIDETHDLTATEDAAGDPECRTMLGTIASQGNSVEIYTWVYTQHGSLETSVGSEQIRGNLPWRTCYRVAEARHGQYCIAQYAKLDASKLEEQGTCYTQDGPKAPAEQIRTPYMPHSLLKKIAAQNARLLGDRPPLRLWCGSEPSPVPGVTWQRWWDTRWLRLDEAFRASSPQYQQYAAIISAGSPAEAHAAASEVAAAARAAAVPVASEPGQGSPAESAARIDEELACYSGVDEAAILPRSDLGSVIKTEIERFIVALESAPPQGISRGRLIAESGRARTWVQMRLDGLIELEAVTRVTRGMYQQLPGADLRQAMARIDAEAARLYAEAKEMEHAA